MSSFLWQRLKHPSSSVIRYEEINFWPLYLLRKGKFLKSHRNKKFLSQSGPAFSFDEFFHFSNFVISSAPFNLLSTVANIGVSSRWKRITVAWSQHWVWCSLSKIIVQFKIIWKILHSMLEFSLGSQSVQHWRADIPWTPGPLSQNCIVILNCIKIVTVHVLKYFWLFATLQSMSSYIPMPRFWKKILYRATGQNLYRPNGIYTGRSPIYSFIIYSMQSVEANSILNCLWCQSTANSIPMIIGRNGVLCSVGCLIALFDRLIGLFLEMGDRVSVISVFFQPIPIPNFQPIPYRYQIHVTLTNMLE